MKHFYLYDQIYIIVYEHKALIHAYTCEPLIKNVVDWPSNRSSFKYVSYSFGIQFLNLMQYYDVVARFFLGTSTIKFDFSILCWEKDLFRKNYQTLDSNESCRKNNLLFKHVQMFSRVFVLKTLD